MNNATFDQMLLSANSIPLQALGPKILQINLGYRCNMACKHCHVAGSPERTEVMETNTVEQVLRVFLDNPFETLDITGGAPELNPAFRGLVSRARKAGRHVVARTNLTVFFEEGMADLPEFYQDHNVDLIASLPYYLEDGVDRVRGSGTFKKSIEALKRLNSLGYGAESSGRRLSLVYNPQGMFLAPAQATLEAEYKRELQKRFGVSFSCLYTFTNMPIGRFREFLVRTNNLDKYREMLSRAFNPMTLDNIMCRHLINVGWDGKIHDCDFNQVLDLAVMSASSGHISAFDYASMSRRTIAVGDHCFGCTAGQGSS